MHAHVINQIIRKIMLILVFLFIALTVLSACAPAATEAPIEPAEPALEPEATEWPEEPVEPAPAPAPTEEPAKPEAQFPVQYGPDSRTELFQHTDLQLQEMAESVAIFVHTKQVKISGNSVTLDGYTLNEMSEMGWLVKDTNAPLCAGELFVSQIAPGFCTGFLVEEDILITAGHCVDKIPCSDTSIVFGFHMQSPNSLAALTKNDVFRCERVIAQTTTTQDNQNLDYAIVKLDRPTGQAGLSYPRDDLLGAQDSVAVIGHPSGIPLKIASSAIVLSNEAEEPFFVTNLDTFGSNSGSPVINMDTYQVEGILVRGMTDYVLSDEGACVKVNRCPEGGGANCAGENATKMSVLAEFIPESKAAESPGLNCFPNLLLVLVLMAMVQLKST